MLFGDARRSKTSRVSISNDEVDREDVLVDQDNGISAGRFVRNRDEIF